MTIFVTLYSFQVARTFDTTFVRILLLFMLPLQCAYSYEFVCIVQQHTVLKYRV